MAINLTEADIKNFLKEPKQLDQEFRQKIRLRDKKGHKEQELDVTGANGNEFRLILRQSNYNPLDFSIILAYCHPKINQLFRLRRYNGKSHEHTNIIEANKFYNFHIHTATERYQELGVREDSYAEQSNRYSDFNSAITCMVADCGFKIPKNAQQNLFEEIEQ